MVNKNCHLLRSLNYREILNHVNKKNEKDEDIYNDWISYCSTGFYGL